MRNNQLNINPHGEVRLMPVGEENRNTERLVFISFHGEEPVRHVESELN